MRVSGRVIAGLGAWRPRMEQFPDVFLRATGKRLFPGTLNVLLDAPLPIQVEFTIDGSEIEEPDQDMHFESCLVDGFEAWRLRPYQPATGLGGHGDHVLEIVSAEALRPLIVNPENVLVEFPNRGLQHRPSEA